MVIKNDKLDVRIPVPDNEVELGSETLAHTEVASRLREIDEQLRQLAVKRLGIEKQLTEVERNLDEVPPDIASALENIRQLAAEVGLDPVDESQLGGDDLTKLNEKQAELREGLSGLEKQEVILKAERAAAVISSDFEDLVKGRYGEDGSEGYLAYHNEKHPRYVEGKLTATLDIFLEQDPQLFSELVDSDDEVVIKAKVGAMAKVLAYAHDSVQKANIASEGRARVRHRGFETEDIDPVLRQEGVVVGNERASADEMIERIKEYQVETGEEVFSQKMVDEMVAAIAATYVEWNSERNTLWQKHLSADAGPFVWSMAMADIRGGSGAGTYGEFTQSGNAEFAELTPNLQVLIDSAQRGDEDSRVTLTGKIIDWKRTQAGFARGQGVLFAEALKSLDDNVLVVKSPGQASAIREGLSSMYSEFGSNSAQADSTYRALEGVFGVPGVPEKMDQIGAEISALTRELKPIERDAVWLGLAAVGEMPNQEVVVHLGRYLVDDKSVLLGKQHVELLGELQASGKAFLNADVRARYEQLSSEIEAKNLEKAKLREQREQRFAETTKSEDHLRELIESIT